jgi:outer membrane receptor protein involved in Fe transport
MRYKLFLLLLISLFAVTSAFAASGKLRGSVVDDKTKEALIGASIVIVGTNYGAVTDVDGNYIIQNVPPGTYSLRSSFISYQNVTISNVKVSEDLTTEINFRLTSSEVQLSEVVIINDRPLVNKNATNAVRISTQEDIQNLPIRGIQAAIALSPGVVLQNGNLYVRGGRADEVGYYLEGANTRSISSGNNLTTVIPDALEEFQVQAGGYTAEYGGANSGIVRQSLKAGGQEYKLSVRAETDNFTPQYTKKLGTYSYGYSDYTVTVGGPIPGLNNVKFFISGENIFQRDNSVRFWEGFAMDSLPDDQSATGYILPKYEIKPGNIPGLSNRYTTNGTLSFDFQPILVRVGGSFSRQRTQNIGNGDIIANVFATQRLGITDNSNLLLNTKLTHILSTTTSYDFNISYMDQRSKTFDPDHGDNVLKYNDSIANAAYGYPFVNYTTGPTKYTFYSFDVNKFGTTQAGFNKQQQTRFGASFDITSQVSSEHQLKIGASIEEYRVSNFNTGSANLLTYYRNNPDDARTPSLKRDYAVAQNGGVNNYGYDWYGNKIDDINNVDGPKAPRYIGAYLQDKIEYSDLVVNAGVRLDYMDNDDFEFVDDPSTPDVIEGPDNPSVDNTIFTAYPVYKAEGIKKTKAFVAVSPRLGFSFPVSERTVFHLQYGKFIQPPALQVIYRGRGNSATVFSGGNFISNPIGYNIQPERTTTYEVGFTQQFTDNAAVDITGFYKDVMGQIQIQRQKVANGANVAGYNTYANGDFVTTKGIEVSIRLRRINRLRAQFNYTFSDAQGTGSTTNAAVSSVEAGSLYPSVISPLDFNQRHKGSVNLDYSFGKNDGGMILEQLGANVLFTYNSGHPFTRSTGSIGQQGSSTGALVESDPRNSVPLEAVNASTTPWVFNFDLRVFKGFEIGSVNAEVYVYVQNLLNTKNVLNVYRRTGNAFDDGFLSNSDLSGKIKQSLGAGYEELYTKANIVNGRSYKNTAPGNPDLFGTPRQIRFGIHLQL